jgi:hypothetical protein
MNQMYGQNAQLSIAQNPKLFANSYTILVILGEVSLDFFLVWVHALICGVMCTVSILLQYVLGEVRDDLAS